MSTILNSYTNDAISVVMPARNAEKTIEEAITSIVCQTYKNLELIVVDDNSQDKTLEIAKHFAIDNSNVSVFQLPEDDLDRFDKNNTDINAGWIARNYGIERISGDWITFQDADDVSLLNRIEVQYSFACKYQSSHVCIDWQKYFSQYVGKILNVDPIINNTEEEDLLTDSREIVDLSVRCKGIIPTYLRWIHDNVPHNLKTRRILNRIFFGDLQTPYPGAGNCTLIRAGITQDILFRPLNGRVWPSLRGRGADRDFNFNVAQLVGDSISVKLPMYLWRIEGENNANYIGSKFIPV